MRERYSIAVLFATFNRLSTTKRFISSFEFGMSKEIDFELWAFDDGSSDGTYEMMLQSNVDRIFTGDSSTYWNKSMAILMDAALSEVRFDGVLLSNDDINLFENWGKQFFESLNLFPDSILVGEFNDPIDGMRVYGGLNSSRFNPMKFNISKSINDAHRMVDTAHANFLYIPRSVIQKIGRIDQSYAHGFGDFDITLRASMEGIPVITIGVLGECNGHLQIDEINPIKRLARVLSIKNLPIKSQVHFAFKFGRIRGLLFAFNPYLRAFFNIKQRSDAGGISKSDETLQTL